MSNKLSDRRRRLVRAAIACAVLAFCFGLAVQIVTAQQASGCVVTGVVRANGIPLPGVAVMAVEVDSKAARASSSGPDGLYRITLAVPGRYQVSLRLAGFAPVVREIDPQTLTCPYTLDFTLVLASRAPKAEAAAPSAGATAAPQSAAQPAGGAPARGQNRAAAAANGGRQGGRGSANAGQAGSQRPGDLTVTPETTTEQVDPAARMLLPPGFSIEAPTEVVTAAGNAGQMNEMFLFGEGRGGRGGMDAFGGMFGDDPTGQSGQPGQPGDGGRGGGRGGPGGGGGRGGPAGGMLGRALAEGGGRGAFGPGGFGGGMRNANRIRLAANYNLGGSALDAAPYALTSQPVQKPSYLSQRFGASAGGPLNIPKLLDGNKTSFFVNYTGNHSSNAYSAYSTVPTLAQRSGDLSAFTRQIYDPETGLPFPGNQVPASRISPTAVALLNLFPAPTLAATTQNFYYATTTTTSQDDINLRVIRNFGTAQRGRGGRMGGLGGGGRGGGRGGGGAPGVQNLTIGVHYHRSTGASANPFPALGGTNEAHAWDIPVNYSFTKWGLSHMTHARYNRSESQTFGNFAFSQDVAGEAGIVGISTDPFDWGAPGVSLSSFSGLRDINPTKRVAQTVDVGDSIVKMKGRHVLRFGGDYRAYLTDSRTDSNARGSFTFTGLYSGLDFADFLLGMPQQATVQFSPGTERFRGRSWDLFLQDDWRVNSKVTLNLGVRYEFVSPFWEANGHLVTLDANSDFTAAVPVQAGQVGPFSGPLPSSIVRPDYNDIAPRIGLAWRANDKTIVRGGYGINYNAGVYNTIVTQLAAQPPFAAAGSNLGTVASPMFFPTALLFVSNTTTNTYGIDPNYRLGYVQIWNVDVQRSLGRTAVLGVGYTGTHGANLDIQRAPNRGPNGLRIPGVLPFLWETSQGSSTMNSVSVRLQKRLTRGFSGGVNYTYSRAFDDASTIGGGGATVAQNDQDLAAEWGPSSFSQPHRLAANASYELPFGRNKRWLNTDSAVGDIFGNWQLVGNFSVTSGSVFTPRVTGSTADVARGVNGTLRADYTGAPIYLDNPTIGEWFNTAAFVVPPSGSFGTAGRNSLRGPTSTSFDMAMAKDFPFGNSGRGINVRVQATNILNMAVFSTIDTVVNSPTYGRVVGVRPMRSVQLFLRFRF